jgi:Arc/MetJ-type ribon-helix-helix transcriptional regulator
MMMYSTYIMRRTQIYIEDGQAEALARRARARGETASHVIREAISRYLSEPDDEAERLARFRDAVDDTFGVAPYLPPGEEYVSDLRVADRQRDERLEERWRR